MGAPLPCAVILLALTQEAREVPRAFAFARSAGTRSRRTSLRCKPKPAQLSSRAKGRLSPSLRFREFEGSAFRFFFVAEIFLVVVAPFANHRAKAQNMLVQFL